MVRYGLVAVLVLFPQPRVFAQSEDRVVTIGGTGTALRLMEHLGDAFTKVFPGIRVDTIPGLETSGGIAAVMDGRIDIAVVSRYPDAASNTEEFLVHPFANTPLVFVAARDLGMTDVRLADIAAYFRGGTADDRRIRVVVRPRREALSRAIRALSPAMADALDRARQRPGMLIASTERENLELVERVPGAVGFSSLGQVLAEGRNISIPAIDGVDPRGAAANPARSLPRVDLYLVAQARPGSPEALFLEFVNSCGGHELMVTYGYRPAAPCLP